MRSSVASKLTSVDDLFTTQAERDEEKLERVVEIPLDEISDFHNHPYYNRFTDQGTAASRVFFRIVA